MSGKINENFKIEVNAIILQSPTILFEVNILYATCIVKLLKKALNVWMEEVKKPISQDLEEKRYWKKMFRVYLNILEAYDLFQKTFRLLVTFCIIYTISYSLMTVSIGIQMDRLIGGGMVVSAFSISNGQWLIRNIFLLALFCSECEKFYGVLNEIQLLNALFMKSTNHSDSQVKMLKNIQRLQRASFKKMSAYGLFVVDATLPLQLAGIISTYTIAQLQLVLP